MKKIISCISITIMALFSQACQDFLEIQPLDRVPGSQLFSDPAGIITALATVYNKMPMEDFNYEPGEGFNFHVRDNPNRNSNGGWSINGLTDDALVGINTHGGYQPGTNLGSYWDYQGIRQVNQFMETVAGLPADILSENDRKRLTSEAHFVRAYIYFTMARRYGGVPLVTAVQSLNDDLAVPRSTEKATWDFVLNECDLAIENLPTATASRDGAYRATKWAAYGLKSRAALHAASVAKYWNNAPLTGDAVTAGLVGGMTETDANNYYLQCINASKEIIDNSGRELFKPNPASVEEATKNLQAMFETPEVAEIEIIFKKAYIDGSATSEQGHSTDLWFLARQVKVGTKTQSSRYMPTLDVIEIFEDYTDNGNGLSATLKTREDGVEDDVVLYPREMNISKPFIHYDNQYDIFKDKDARLHAWILVPGSVFKGTLINMQGGLIAPDGTKNIFTTNSVVGLDGITYYGYGSESTEGYSGFAKQGQEDENYSQTGFALRKFLQEAKTVNGTDFSSTQSWIDMRLAEIYLNYAEATIESGQGDPALAHKYLNAIRKRAGHMDEIPATLSNILKERRVELLFENHRYWDMIRRRTFHTVFNKDSRGALVPILDLRENPPKYIFLRSVSHLDRDAGGRTFNPRSYYLSIPGVATNNLIQNPQY